MIRLMSLLYHQHDHYHCHDNNKLFLPEDDGISVCHSESKFQMDRDLMRRIETLWVEARCISWPEARLIVQLRQQAAELEGHAGDAAEGIGHEGDEGDEGEGGNEGQEGDAAEGNHADHRGEPAAEPGPSASSSASSEAPSTTNDGKGSLADHEGDEGLKAATTSFHTGSKARKKKAAKKVRRSLITAAAMSATKT